MRRWFCSLRVRMAFLFVVMVALPLLAVGMVTLGSDHILLVREPHQWAGSLFLTLTIAILMAVLQGLIVARGILNSVRSLEADFQRIGSGDFELVQPRRSFSELEPLNESMMRMVSALEERHASFKKVEGAWSRAFDAFPDLVFVLDQDQRIMDVNRAALDKLGANKSEVLNQRCCSLLHGFFDLPEKCPNELMKESGNPASVGIACPSLSGYFSVRALPLKNEAGESTGSLHILQDATEQKRAQKGEALLAAAIEQIQELILITDTDGLIQYTNPAFQQFTEHEQMDLRGLQVGMISRESHKESLWTRVFEKLEGKERWSGDIEGLQTDGSRYHMQLLVSPVRDPHGAITNLVSIGRDITNETRIERQLRQAQKMEALGTLAGGIAHDFNNILTGVIGHAEMASFKTDEESPIRHHIVQVLNAGHRAKDLVKQILAFSHQTEQEYCPVQVGIIIKEALKLLRASLPTTIEIHHDIVKNVGLVLADPTQVHQVLMNLCSNAAHAMREKGGLLEVSLREIDLNFPEEGLHPHLEPGRYLKLVVGDTGHGMTRETLERIFDPFFTTKNLGEGTGMGLSVVYGIVKSHSGAIYASSEPGRGSRFTVLLPIVNNAQQKRQDGVGPQFCCPGGSEHILLVDDEEVLVSVGHEIMQHLGYRVTPMTSSAAALEIFRAQPDTFDLVVTDQTMPQMTGIELAKSLFQTRPGLPIILCTGYSDIVSSETAKAAGIREFLMKPYVLRDFAQTIRRVLDESFNGCAVTQPKDFGVNSLESHAQRTCA
jgi:PAS domain S-box-containing protein